MPRSGEQARSRLQEAAIVLYGRNGYDATTTAEIAAAAGVTERTFFRHFADKREVLFGGESVMRESLTAAIAEVSGTPASLAILRAAFRTVVPYLESHRPLSEPRSRIIAETPALRERELAKAANMVEVVADALTARGIPARRARLTAEVGMATIGEAIRLWRNDSAGDLDEYITRSFDDLKALCTEPDAFGEAL
ncbi:TetR family transcriptional regulator [Nocardia sp. CA2R105]|uniref:TetR/AcrR family transcriptional regulator n=1 Tax=Nocardia coffeae TaxID=2873381 RepID=UPI001CA7A7F4|nr:TetR family transcriptional regulator [Nocardia coffeae]MBY8861918.1 TetR family transcriptional regulator [Nocardia coffeae]